MRHGTGRFIAPLMAAAVFSSCTEQATGPAAEPLLPQATTTATGTCDVFGTMQSDVTDYFPAGQARTNGQELREFLVIACATGAQTATRTAAIKLLEAMQTTFNFGGGSSATAGARLTRSLLACTTSVCSSSALPTEQSLPNAKLVGALGSPAGVFAVRHGTSNLPALARGPVAMSGNSAQWGVEATVAWAQAVRNPLAVVLLYGQPAPGPVAYDFNVWPRHVDGFIQDNVVHVGVCFAQEYIIDDADIASNAGRMKRESSLIAAATPGFCANGAQQLKLASLMTPLTAAARSVLPSHWFASAAIAATGVRQIGGSASDFSVFTPTAADTIVPMAMKGPATVVTAGQSFGGIEIEVRATGGDPIHRARVRLEVARNRGEPAGAVIEGDIFAYTNEQGIATFSNNIIPKPGGYIVCATADLPGYVLQPACSNLFLVLP